ncbi:MAG: propanediol/glycerol family dehydratase large subunit [Thermoleophilia bacterium]|nr:propanediol/glycerol family dehydratase large subunit [Thermoleophilia bacterium]
MEPAEGTSRRSAFYATRTISRDVVVPEYPELGLIAFASPNDPEPSIRVENGRIVEIDGRTEADFDLIDAFLASHGINPAVAEEAMALDDLAFARMLCGHDVPRTEILRLVEGMTPAKVARILGLLSPLELMQAMAKMRARRTPSIQAHVTNRIDHPLLIAADAASAVALGFRELETTVPVLRDAPLVALALLIGSQVPAPGALTQCSVEEKTELELGLRGLTTYAETVSVYGTEQVFLDGDDTPWSKALLASSYASRGLKMRFTSGSGAEVLMGGAEGKSMLYLEARCVAITRAAGSQGTQNGGIDGINVTGSVPNGMREILAENVMATLYGLESCTGNDTQMSASDIRRTAHTLPLLLAGSDFLFSGFGSIPSYDNTFGASNFNAEDIDDYMMIQRDWGFEGVLRSQGDDTLLPLRRRAAEACRAVLDELDLMTFDDAELERVVTAHGSLDVSEHQTDETARAGDAIIEREITAVDVVRALSIRGFELEAERVLEMTRQRLFGDHLQTSAIFAEDMSVLSALTDPNDYAGPGTGYRPSSVRLDEMARVRQERSHVELLAEQAPHAGCVVLTERGPAAIRPRPDEVVIGISPAFGVDVWLTLSGLTVGEALRQILAGIEEEGVHARVVRVTHSLDLGMIGWTAANLSGSGVALGIQGKGTALIHRADLPTLANLELLSMAPLIDDSRYRLMGRNAARHARGEKPSPVLLPESGEPMGPRYHAKVVALINRESQCLRAGNPQEIEVTWPS